jgi:hypothetical protein
LCGQLQDIVTYRIQRKADLLVLWDLRNILWDIPGPEVLLLLSIPLPLGKRIMTEQTQQNGKYKN